MRIAYCTNVRLPSERAHGHQVAQVCDALEILGHDVTVFCPFRNNTVREDFWAYYGVPKSIKLRTLGSFDPIESLLLPGLLGLLWLNRAMRSALKAELAQARFDVLYTRSPALLPALLQADIPVILELHQLPRRGRRGFVRRCERCRLVACLTSSMKNTLEQWGVPSEKLCVAGDAVDLRRFAQNPSQEGARHVMGVSTPRLVVGYVGRLKTLGMDKGVADLLKAIALLRERRLYLALIVGGPESDRREYEAMARELGLTSEDVVFTGEVPAHDVPLALAACNVLAMPFPDMPHYRHHMSPLKMFEYMAANRTIVTSDLPTVRDVLSDETAVFCAPGDAKSLAEALMWIVEHREDAQQKAKNARTLVQEHTWEVRMKRILNAAMLAG